MIVLQPQLFLVDKLLQMLQAVHPLYFLYILLRIDGKSHCSTPLSKLRSKKCMFNGAINIIIIERKAITKMSFFALSLLKNSDILTSFMSFATSKCKSYTNILLSSRLSTAALNLSLSSGYLDSISLNLFFDLFFFS